MTALIVARNLSWAVDGRPVLCAIDVTVDAGGSLAIVGPNGAGKSTLLKLLAGSLKPDAGQVEVLGRDPATATARELATRLAYLGPTVGSDIGFTAREVVEMGRHPHRLTERTSRDQEVIEAAMSDLDTSHLADHEMRTLSTGEARRVSIARVLAQEAATTLLDEPTASLDLGHQASAMAAVSKRVDAGGAVVTVLHDLNLAARFADRIMLLAEGRIAAEGNPGAVLKAERLSDVYGRRLLVIDHPDGNHPLVVA